MEPTWHDGLSRKALVELVEGLLLAMDKSVPRLDAIAHHLSLMPQQGEELEVLGGISDQMADIGDELYAASDRDKLREWGNEIDATGQGALTRGTGARQPSNLKEGIVLRSAMPTETLAPADERPAADALPGSGARGRPHRRHGVASAAPRTSSTARSCSASSRAPGYELVADAEARPTSSSSTPAPSSTGPSRSRSTPSSRWRATRSRAGRSGWWSRAASPSATTPSCAGRSRRSTPRSGTGQVEDIVRAVGGRGHGLAGEAPGPAHLGLRPHRAARPLDAAVLAYVKISEGCDYTCSFCIIPTLRGRHRSRGVEDIVAEAQALAARGVKEIVLVAQDSTRYGLDLGRARRARLPAAPARADRRHPLDPRDVRLPGHPHRPDPRRDGLRGEGRQVRGHPAPARERGGAQADEAAHRAAATSSGMVRADPRARARSGHPHLLHRRLPGRDRGGLRASCSRSSRPAEFDNVGRLHLLRRGGDDLVRPGRAGRRPG